MQPWCIFTINMIKTRYIQFSWAIFLKIGVKINTYYCTTTSYNTKAGCQDRFLQQRSEWLLETSVSWQVLNKRVLRFYLPYLPSFKEIHRRKRWIILYLYWRRRRCLDGITTAVIDKTIIKASAPRYSNSLSKITLGKHLKRMTNTREYEQYFRKNKTVLLVPHKQNLWQVHR